MPKYLTLVLMILIAAVLDYYCFSNLGNEVVAAHRTDSFTQLFTGAGWDWTGLVIFNITAIVTGYFASTEKDFYEGTPKLYQFGFLAALIISLLMIAIG